MNQEQISALETWVSQQNRAWRAAGELLLHNGHWLDDANFVELCCDFSDDGAWIDWHAVDAQLAKGSLLGSAGEVAVLRWSAEIALDGLDASSMDRDNRALVAEAIATALGVTR